MADDLRTKLAGQYSKEAIHKAIGKSRQHYFQQQQSVDISSQEEALVISIVKNWRINHPRMGSRALYYSLKKAEIELGMGVTKFEQLLSISGLTVGKIKRFGPNTTDSSKSNTNYPNLTNGLKLNDINQLIVADITYIWIDEKWCYLFIFKDVYSQRILSIIASENMEAINCHMALSEIIDLRGEAALKGCILHTDNGSQFDANDFKEMLDDLDIQISRAKHCEENGSAEQINHIVKNMYLNHWSIANFKQLCKACKTLKILNNTQRCIKQLGYQTPIGFEASLLKIPINKRVIKQLYDFNEQQ